MTSRPMLYLRTVARMKPSMVASRLRGMRSLPKGFDEAQAPDLAWPAIAVPALDLDPAYRARFDLTALGRGEFLLINERHGVDLSAWQAPEASHLWNFNLHYFEYCVPLAARYSERRDPSDYATFKYLVTAWMAANPYAQGDAWHPYTTSLRLINWLVCADLFRPALQGDPRFADAMRRSMYRQYRHLLLNQERHLLANHYLENLKTLLVCAWAFGEDDVAARVQRDFEAQLDEQILPDGVHFERSLMYHKLILEGLLRVALAARATGHELPAALPRKAQQMLDAMASLEKGMGKTPFFNDSADGVAKDRAPLAAACEAVLGLRPDDSKADFPDAGYYKLYDGDVAVMFDAGAPGPSYVLGHAHCDALSYEASVAGRPVLVNGGTYAYQSDRRPYFRSTAAHNTVLVDGEEQLECWGEHRVARGYRNACVAYRDQRRIVAGVTLPSGAVVMRDLSLEGGVLTVVDAANGKDAQLRSVVHCVPGAPAAHAVATEAQVARGTAAYSPEFGKLEECETVELAARETVAYRINLANEALAEDAGLGERDARNGC